MKLPKSRKFNRNRSRYLFIVTLLCITLGIVVGALAFTARSQSHKTGPTSNDVSADQSNAVSIPSTSPKTDPTPTATPTPTTIPTATAPKPKTATSAKSAAPTQPIATVPPSVPVTVNANLSHMQYCAGDNNMNGGTVEYVISIYFWLSGGSGQSATLTYVIETQTGEHSDISYPRTATIPAGKYDVIAQTPTPPGPLAIFTFDDFDEPGAIRVRVTAPYSYTGPWQVIEPSC